MNINGHYDGWTQRYIGPVLLRRNFEHISRCVQAIRNRFDSEIEITIEEQADASQDLRGSGRVILLETSRAKRTRNS